MSDLGFQGREVEMLESALFYMIFGSAAAVLALLLVCCLWDAATHWQHLARFRACERKVRRANEAFSSRKGELPLCPYCVEPITQQPSPSKVVFLCGHRFHTDCCNAWFLQSPTSGVRCPICEVDADAYSFPAIYEALKGANECSDGQIDEAQTFVLLSLHKQFPEIIPEACLHRWTSCHTQIWLSELTCPRYNSVLKKHRQKSKSNV